MHHVLHLRQILERVGEVTFVVRVHPGAKRTCMRSVMDDGAIKVDIATTPEDGKANIALIRFLAETFSVQSSHVRILSGISSRMKTVWITRVGDPQSVPQNPQDRAIL